MNKHITVLIVDDSSFMRVMLKKMLEEDPAFNVVGFAANGLEAIEKTKELHPDIVTMDVEMPVMNGIEAVERIMKECPTNIIMVSTLTTEGATETLRALEMGAVDFIPKNLGGNFLNISGIKETIKSKIKQIVAATVFRGKPRGSRPGLRRERSEGNAVSSGLSVLKKDFAILAIGSSTGGPRALSTLLPQFPARPGYPVLIVQHMPKTFTAAFAKRLDKASPLSVKEAEQGESVKNDVVYIAPGGKHLTLRRSGKNLTVDLTENSAKHLHCPAVDVMMQSVASLYKEKTMGMILTGMGKDGLYGFQSIKRYGGSTIAQEKKSCTVYGMPRAVIEEGLADVVLPLEEISSTLLSLKLS